MNFCRNLWRDFYWKESFKDLWMDTCKNFWRNFWRNFCSRSWENFQRKKNLKESQEEFMKEPIFERIPGLICKESSEKNLNELLGDFLMESLEDFLWDSLEEFLNGTLKEFVEESSQYFRSNLRKKYWISDFSQEKLPGRFEEICESFY